MKAKVFSALDGLAERGESQCSLELGEANSNISMIVIGGIVRQSDDSGRGKE